MPTIALYLRKGAERTSARRHRRIAGAATAAVVCGSVLLSGCQAPPDTPKIIVIAASATANEPAPVLAAPDRAMLLNAGNGTNAVAFVVDPNTGQASEVSLTPRRAGGEVDYGPDRDRELTANVNRVQQLLNTLAASGPFDLLTMTAQAVRVSSVPGTLLVLSSGLSTAGGFDLNQVGWGADARTVAVWLNDRGLLPRLAGWHVVFSGLADTAGRQPALPLPQRTTLTSYWLTLCQVAGAASCAVNAVTRPEPPARSTTPVPVVAFPHVTSFRSPQGQTTDIPADAFFSFNSARLLPGADAVPHTAGGRGPRPIPAGNHCRICLTRRRDGRVQPGAFGGASPGRQDAPHRTGSAGQPDRQGHRPGRSRPAPLRLLLPGPAGRGPM